MKDENRPLNEEELKEAVGGFIGRLDPEHRGIMYQGPPDDAVRTENKSGRVQMPFMTDALKAKSVPGMKTEDDD